MVRTWWMVFGVLGAVLTGCTEPPDALDLDAEDAASLRSPGYAAIPLRPEPPPAADHYTRVLSRTPADAKGYGTIRDVMASMEDVVDWTSCRAQLPEFPAVSSDDSVVVLALTSGTWESRALRLRFYRSDDGTWLGDRTLIHGWEHPERQEPERLAARLCERAHAVDRLLGPGHFESMELVGTWGGEGLPAPATGSAVASDTGWFRTISGGTTRSFEEGLGHGGDGRLGIDIVLAREDLGPSVELTASSGVREMCGDPEARTWSQVFERGELSVFERGQCGC